MNPSAVGTETVLCGRPHATELIPTNRDLLDRLRNLDDHDSWNEFFHLYRHLIYRAAIRTRLSTEEAEEVVQRTMIALARRMETFRYEPERCSFKGWLMHLTRGHVYDCFKRRRTQAKWFAPLDTLEASVVEGIPDREAELAFETLWTEEWRNHLRHAAESRVRHRINPAHYEIYHLHCVQDLSINEVSERLHVFPLTVRVVCHRVALKVRREVERLEDKLV